MLLASFISMKLIIVCFEVCKYEVLGALENLGGVGAGLSMVFAISKMGTMSRGAERSKYLAENWNYTLNMSTDANQRVIMEK